MKVLSLFDGMSCGRIALERAGFHVEKYFASEIEKAPMIVSNANYPDIIQIGDVTKISYKTGILTTENGQYETEIDLLIGGSPCQGFSMAGKQIAFDDPRSKLYFEYERILNEIKLHNPKVKFLLENVKMKQESKNVITERLGVQPIEINSNIVSAQNRYRLYWTNIINVKLPENKNIKLVDILQENVDDKYRIKSGRLKWLHNFGEVNAESGFINFKISKRIAYPVREIGRRLNSDGVRKDENKDIPISRWLEVGETEKSNCLTAVQKDSYILQWPHGANSGGIRALDGKVPAMTVSAWEHNNLLLHGGLVRKLTPEECEILQTVPVGYSSMVSDSKRYKMLGNGWTVDVIAHIFSTLNDSVVQYDGKLNFEE